MNSERQLKAVIEELSSDGIWKPPVPELFSSSLHIWQFPLTAPAIGIENCIALLSEDERVRASAFHFERDSRRFTVARASVRSILGAYTKSSARDLRFHYSQYGKPALADATPDVRFSVSHSGELALLAVALGQEVGVDLEVIRQDVEIEQLAARFFSDLDSASLLTLPNELRVHAFFRCWTRKEAFLKAQGLGLSRSLNSFDVEVNPDKPARLLATRPDPQEAQRWAIHDVTAEENCAAAAAWEGLMTEMKIFRCR